MMRRFLPIALALAPTTAIAQTAAGAPTASAVVPAPEPARLAAAERLLDIMMPPATRDQMIQAMMEPMLANIRQGMTQGGGFAKLMGDNPKVAAAFDHFMQQQNVRTVALIQSSMPGMIDAMSRAYARRFDVTQLGEIERFFQTPTGVAYMRASMTIMGDPDIATWQRTMMATAMGHVRDDAVAFSKDIAAIQQGEKK